MKKEIYVLGELWTRLYTIKRIIIIEHQLAKLEELATDIAEGVKEATHLDTCECLEDLFRQIEWMLKKFNRTAVSLPPRPENLEQAAMVPTLSAATYREQEKLVRKLEERHDEIQHNAVGENLRKQLHDLNDGISRIATKAMYGDLYRRLQNLYFHSYAMNLLRGVLNEKSDFPPQRKDIIYC